MVEWIVRDGRPGDAAGWLDDVWIAIASLATHPRRAPLAPEEELLGLELRQLLVGVWRLVYVVERDEVVLLHVRHGARLPAHREELRPTD